MTISTRCTLQKCSINIKSPDCQSLQNLCIRFQLLNDLISTAVPAALMGIERNNHFPGKIVFVKQCKHDLRKRIAPDGIAHKNHIIIINRNFVDNSGTRIRVPFLIGHRLNLRIFFGSLRIPGGTLNLYHIAASLFCNNLCKFFRKFILRRKNRKISNKNLFAHHFSLLF